MSPRATTSVTAPLLARQARTKPQAGEIATMARETRLDPGLETIRERSDQITRSAALMRILQRHEAGEVFPEPSSSGPSVQLAWTLPEVIAVRFPLRPVERQALEARGITGEPYSPELRARLINAALRDLDAEFKQGWGERVGIKRGHDGKTYAFAAVEAWTAGSGRVITRGVLRRVGDPKLHPHLNGRPLAVGAVAGTPAYPREGGQGLDALWELLDVTVTPEPRTVAVLRAPTAHAAVQAVKAGAYTNLGLAPLDAQLHRPWRGNAARNVKR